MVEKWRSVIARQIGNLQRLVDDLLDVSRITEGKITISRERTSVLAVVERAMETSLPVLESRGHSIELELVAGPTQLDADPIRLSQVISNLLNNAAKCTPAGGHIVVRAEREKGERS